MSNIRCQALRNVPEAKLRIHLERIENDPGLEEKNKHVLKQAYVRYYGANIPVIYWNKEMTRDFKGDPQLLKVYTDIAQNIDKVFADGISLCFAGSFGLGKTLACTNILKRATEKGLTALYVTLNDIISATTSDEKFLARQELLNTHFLVIDEFDPRYIANAQVSDFFGRVLEDVLRSRTQNNLPLFLCTNSPNVLESFQGSLKQSIGSLMNHVKMVPVLGKDYRSIVKGK